MTHVQAGPRLAQPLIESAGAISVGMLLAEAARVQPENVAVNDGRVALTYGQFNRRVNQLANALAAMHVSRHDRIAILSRNSIAYLEIMMAAAKLGATLCCQNWRLSKREIAHTVNMVSPEVIFTEPAYEHLLPQTVAARHIPLDDHYQALIERHPADEPQVAIHPEDILLILYTSGTTGVPKGACISHRAMIYRGLVYASELAVPRDDTFFAWSPLFHIGAADQSIATLTRGGTVFVTDGMQVDLILPALETNRTRWFSLLPGALDTLIDAMETVRPTLKGVGVIGGMGDLVGADRVAQLSKLFNAPYLESFGSTETGLPPATGGLIPIGVAPQRFLKRQSGYCEVRLVDEQGTPVAEGTPGEVVIRGPTLFSGYYNDAEANAACTTDGWYRMGDVMTRDPATGLLEFVDRARYLIKSGGENIYPAEIERVLIVDPRIDEVAIVRKADSRWGEVPIAFVARNTEALSESMVFDLCDGSLARFKRPKEVHFIDASQFPRTSSGKIRRGELEERLLPPDTRK